MNLAILIPELGGGGAERVAQMLGDYCVERGDNVYYFMADSDVGQDYSVRGRIVQTGIKSCMRRKRSDIHRMALLLHASLKIRKLKKQYGIDVAVSFMEEFNYLNVLSKGREKVIARVCTVLSPRKELKGLLYQKNMVRFFYTRADQTVVTSRYALEDMHCHYKVPLKKLVKIPNPAAPVKAREDKAPWPFGTKAAVCVGRLEPVKQQERIIRAFSVVCAKEKEARLLILGRGPQRHYLEQVCERLGIADHVVFAGFTDNIPYYLKHARVFVMASKAEGFPNSMVEAMYYGVPVITTDSPGGCGEIVGKPAHRKEISVMMPCRYGILTPAMPMEKTGAGSPLLEQEVVLGQAILKILTEDEAYENYRKRSYRRAEMFCMERVIKRWEHVMETKQQKMQGKMGESS